MTVMSPLVRAVVLAFLTSLETQGAVRLELRALPSRQSELYSSPHVNVLAWALCYHYHDCHHHCRLLSASTLPPRRTCMQH